MGLPISSEKHPAFTAAIVPGRRAEIASTVSRAGIVVAVQKNAVGNLFGWAQNGLLCDEDDVQSSSQTRQVGHSRSNKTHSACNTYNTCRRPELSTPETTKQNITLRLDRRTLRKAKVLAARRNTSISGLLAEQIETLVGEDDAYDQARRRALALLDRGFHLGGQIESTRDEWHER